MSRWDAGSKVFLLCGCIFVTGGGIFLCACALMLTQIDALALDRQNDARFLPVIFGALGGLMAAIGGALLVWLRRKRKRTERLLERGEYVIAKITGFPVDYQVTINGRPTYRVECSYQDPVTGILHVFESKRLLIDPAFCVTAETVRVYVNREAGYQDYYVDVDPILPRVERH